MARIVIACWGSHGDFDPSLGLALALQRRGHAVTVATIPYFAAHAASAGIAFHAIRPHVDPSDPALMARIMDRHRGSQVIIGELIDPALAAMHEDLAPLARTADLLISHPLTMVVPMLAEQFGIPWASTALAPLSFFSAHDFPVLPPVPWLKRLDALGPWTGRAIVRMGKVVSAPWVRGERALRRRLGLRTDAHPLFEGQHSPHLVLALFSRVLAAPQPDWPSRTEVTGHVFHNDHHGTSLAPELEAFLDAGDPPVVFTLGSSAVLSPGHFWRESLAAVRALGVRAVCLVGPGNAAAMQGQLPPGVLALDWAPHALLMPRAAAVVHQCGVGTLARGLWSGTPLLAVPFSHDQFDNAHRAARIGAARMLPPTRYRAPRVVEGLDALLRDPAYRAAAGGAAAIIREERGAEAASDVIERTFGL